MILKARRFLIYALLSIIMSVSLVGCIATAPREDDKTEFRLSSAADMDRLASALAGKRIVYVGETHDRMDHHRLQLAVLDALQRAGYDLAVGVEWFQHSFQPVLDDYLAGRIDDAELLHRTEYYQRWRFDYRLYQPIIEYAQLHRIPILALNAPRELTDAISAQGLDKLPQDYKALLPSSYDRSNKEYEDFLRSVFELHPTMTESGLFERFLDVQLTWDESMAEQAADYLTRHPEKTLVVFAGSGHIARGAGIPDRVQRRIAVDSTIILPQDIGSAIPDSADILVATQAQYLKPSGILGVFLDADDDGLVIKGFSEENSGARDAGLRAGDRLISVAGKPVPHLSALKLALMEKTPEQKVSLVYRRTGEDNTPVETRVTVTLH